MKFSSSADSLGIVEEIDFLCGTNSTSYPVADKTRNVNRWYYVAATDAWKSSGKWQYDDSNLTSHAIATTDLVADQKDYTVPTDALKIERVEVKDNAGNFYKLEHIDFRDVKGSISEFQETSGSPRYYDMMGNSVWLYPAPATGSVTTTAGLKLYVARELDQFTAADTTQEPGLPEPFHRILSYGAAYDWLIANDQTNRATALRAEIEALRTGLREFLGDQNRDIKRGIRTAHSVRNYL